MKRLLTSSSTYWLELDFVSRAQVPIPGIPTEDSPEREPSGAEGWKPKIKGADSEEFPAS